MSVGAVIVTFRRPDIVRDTTLAALAQTTAPDWVVVVDNDADDAVRDLLAAEAPGVIYVAAPGNNGYGAGLAVGMRELRDRHDPDWYWLMDDDTPPRPDHLAEALVVTDDPRRPWVVANRGGLLHLGRVRHARMAPGQLVEADFTLVDGTLVSRTAVEAIGVPREDLFMMCEDLDYTTRIGKAGGVMLIRQADTDAMHLGSGAEWRSYYHARNHLRIAVDRRSPSMVFGWAWRTFGLLVADVRYRRWLRLRLRTRGIADGVRGRMGRIEGLP